MNTFRYWTIKAGRKKYATINFPNNIHPDTFTIEFYQGINGTITEIPDIHTAVEKCKKWCKEYFEIDEITDEKGYPLELLGCFEDKVFDDVKPENFVFVVHGEYSTKVFREQKTAKKYFNERLNYYMTHKPDENDRREYKVELWPSDDADKGQVATVRYEFMGGTIKFHLTYCIHEVI